MLASLRYAADAWSHNRHDEKFCYHRKSSHWLSQNQKLKCDVRFVMGPMLIFLLLASSCWGDARAASCKCWRAECECRDLDNRVPVEGSARHMLSQLLPGSHPVRAPSRMLGPLEVAKPVPAVGVGTKSSSSSLATSYNATQYPLPDSSNLQPPLDDPMSSSTPAAEPMSAAAITPASDTFGLRSPAAGVTVSNRTVEDQSTTQTQTKPETRSQYMSAGVTVVSANSTEVDVFLVRLLLCHYRIVCAKEHTRLIKILRARSSARTISCIQTPRTVGCLTTPSQNSSSSTAPA